jgi:hypothetical protein
LVRFFELCFHRWRTKRCQDIETHITRLDTERESQFFCFFADGDNATLYSSTWEFTGLLGASLTSGSSYYVTVRALDNAVPSNDEGYYSSRSPTFTFDNVAPSIVVQNPTDSSFFTNAIPLTISGTAQDAVSGVQAVQVRIQNGANYWTGTHNAAGNFTTTQSTVTADLALLPTWQFIIPAGELTADFVQGQTYQFSARSWDVAGTTSAFTAIASAIYEIEAPTAAVTSPSAFSNAAPLTISGTAVDSIAGVFKVEVAISSSATAGNGTWYNGTSFSVDLTSNTVWRTTSTWTGSIPGTINWTWATGLTLTNNTTYSILLRTTDRAGNVYTQTLAERKTFLYDNASPSAGSQGDGIAARTASRKADHGKLGPGSMCPPRVLNPAVQSAWPTMPRPPATSSAGVRCTTGMDQRAQMPATSSAARASISRL